MGNTERAKKGRVDSGAVKLLMVAALFLALAWPANTASATGETTVPPDEDAGQDSGASGDSASTTSDPEEISLISVAFADVNGSPAIDIPAVFGVQLQVEGESICRFDADDIAGEAFVFEEECLIDDRVDDVVATLVDLDEPDGPPLTDRTGVLRIEDGQASVLFTPVSGGSILMADLERPGDEASLVDALDGPVRITVPQGCGSGVVEDAKMVLYVNGGQPVCSEAQELTIQLDAPTGPQFQIEPPDPGSVEERGRLVLTDPAIGRGGLVTIQTSSASVNVQPGLRLSFMLDNQDCGISDINENHAYAVSLAEPCEQGSSATALLVGTEVPAVPVELGGEETLAVGFGVPEGRVLVMGRALSRGAALPEGGTIDVTGDADLACGSAVVQRDGAYLLLMSPACATSGSLRATVRSSELTTTFAAPDASSPSAVLVFETPNDDTEAQEIVQTSARVDRLLEPGQVIAILVSILLGAMAALFAKWQSAKAFNDVLIKLAEQPTAESLEVLKVLKEIDRPDYRPVYELVLLAIVAVALVTLTLGGVVAEQGALTILGAIVGYAAGRGTSSS